MVDLARPTAPPPDAPPTGAWHAMPADTVLGMLGCDTERGLDAAEVAQRLRQHGPNALPEPPAQPAWRRLARQFQSPLIAILALAAVLAVALDHRGDAGVILAVVVVNALIGALQEGRAERSMAALRRLSALQVQVRRGGRDETVAARDLVPGDLLLLAAGDAVGADARLVEAVQLHAAEAALTGESVPVAKLTAPLPAATGLADRHNLVFAGTHVSAGRGRAVVVATGAHTEVGRIADLSERAREPPTPLEQRIAAFGRALAVAAGVLFVLVMVLGLWRGLPLDSLLMVAISQMVSMVPEGLPVAMTIALAVGMQRMATRGAVIRRLAAVETLGSTTVICSDKTGTLTRNEMTVTALWLPAADGPGRHIDVSGVGYAPAGALSESGRPVSGDDPALATLLRAAALCNDARLVPPDGPDGEPGDWTVLGDPTEGALRVLAAKAGLDLAALDTAAPREAELPFDSSCQLMATRHRCAGTPRQVLIKGSPESVLRLCAGQLDPPALRSARAAAEAMAAQALRVLAFAVVDDDALDADAGFDALAGRARLLGLAGQIDPPREAARTAVAACHDAGIRVVMVTGDHKLTGLAIARTLGIAAPDDRAVDGLELERMGAADLRDELPHIAVFARVQPAQKLRIVEALQQRGEVVAMTGDGVNDAPALARADVGVAMGITGTEVAKSVARIVVTDDNFATIVGAVEQGRVVYANLKKVILFLFATSIDEVVVLLLALLGGYPLPLAAVQVLWINIVTEGTLTLNLVMDPPDGDEMQRRPVPRDDPLVDRSMLARVLLMAASAVAVTFGWFAWRLSVGADLALVRTETFTLLAMCQWFNLLNCQSARQSALQLGVLKNPWLLGGLTLSVALQAAVLWTPWLQSMFHTVGLAPAALLPLVALASAVLWAEELRKALARRRARR
jgi:Ca2+-transporting ATPase